MGIVVGGRQHGASRIKLRANGNAHRDDAHRSADARLHAVHTIQLRARANRAQRARRPSEPKHTPPALVEQRDAWADSRGDSSAAGPDTPSMPRSASEQTPRCASAMCGVAAAVRLVAVGVVTAARASEQRT